MMGSSGFWMDCVDGTRASLVAKGASLVAKGAARRRSNTSPSAELACPMVKDKVREDK
jgi:hypothetical protein